MSKSKVVASVLFAAALMVCAAANLYASAYGTFSGAVISKEVIMGPGGMINAIYLTVDTHDGNYWTVACTRSQGNLGLCNPVQQWEYIIADGVLTPSGTIGCAGMTAQSITRL